VQPPIRDDASGDRDPRAPSPSARVRLEVELLASEQPVALPAPAVGDELRPRIILVAIADADVRQYVRECLHDRGDLQVLEAPTVAIAERLAQRYPAQILIVAAHDSAVLNVIPDVRAVVITDDVSPDALANGRAVRLLRPFGRQDLKALVDELLA
jgi:hypothetical protein